MQLLVWVLFEVVWYIIDIFNKLKAFVPFVYFILKNLLVGTNVWDGLNAGEFVELLPVALTSWTTTEIVLKIFASVPSVE